VGLFLGEFYSCLSNLQVRGDDEDKRRDESHVEDADLQKDPALADRYFIVDARGCIWEKVLVLSGKDSPQLEENSDKPNATVKDVETELFAEIKDT